MFFLTKNFKVKKNNCVKFKKILKKTLLCPNYIYYNEYSLTITEVIMWNEVLESLVVVKRSGQRVDFNASKIAIAIKKAFDAVYGYVDEKQVYSVFEKVLKYINDNYKDRKTINVEDVQDIIESQLKDLGYEEVYRAFSDYRQKRAASRSVFSEKQQHKFVKVVESIENIDSDLTPPKLFHKFGKIISSEYA